MRLSCANMIWNFFDILQSTSFDKLMGIWKIRFEHLKKTSLRPQTRWCDEIFIDPISESFSLTPSNCFHLVMGDHPPIASSVYCLLKDLVAKFVEWGANYIV